MTAEAPARQKQTAQCDAVHPDGHRCGLDVGHEAMGTGHTAIVGYVTRHQWGPGWATVQDLGHHNFCPDCGCSVRYSIIPRSGRGSRCDACQNATDRRRKTRRKETT